MLPLLAAETTELPLRVTELTALVRADDALLDREAERLLLPAPEPLFSDPCVLRRVRLAPLREAPEPLQRRPLRCLLREALPQDAALVHIRALQALLENPAPAARADLPGRLTVRRSYDALELVRGTPPVFRARFRWRRRCTFLRSACGPSARLQKKTKKFKIPLSLLR